MACVRNEDLTVIVPALSLKGSSDTKLAFQVV